MTTVGYVIFAQQVGSRWPFELDHFEPYLMTDWDSAGALPVSARLYGKAQEFAKTLPPSMPVGSAMAGVDGSVGMYWASARTKMYVDLLVDGRVRYLSTSKDFPRISGILPSEFPLDQLQNVLAKPLRSLLEVGRSFYLDVRESSMIIDERNVASSNVSTVFFFGSSASEDVTEFVVGEELTV